MERKDYIEVKGTIIENFLQPGKKPRFKVNGRIAYTGRIPLLGATLERVTEEFDYLLDTKKYGTVAVPGEIFKPQKEIVVRYSLEGNWYISMESIMPAVIDYRNWQKNVSDGILIFSK